MSKTPSKTSLEIEGDVPLPYRLTPIPFNEMKVGDSVLLAFKKENEINTARQRVWRENRKKKMKFSCFQVSNKAARVFRTA